MTTKEQIAALDAALEGVPAADGFETAVDGSVHPEPFAEERKARIPARFRAVEEQTEGRSKR